MFFQRSSVKLSVADYIWGEKMGSPVDRKLPIQILRSGTTQMLSTCLNPVMVIPTIDGVLRYWRGLMGCCKLDPRAEANIARSDDPTKQVLSLWSEKNGDNSTIEEFLTYLTKMDRYDVIEDVTELIDQDIVYYKEHPTPIVPPSLEMDDRILTFDDIDKVKSGQSLEVYDAFLLYHQDDINFVSQLIDEMETSRGVKLVTKDRDFVAGYLEVKQMVDVIINRCNRVIAVLSDSFLKNSPNTYYLSFAHAYGIESKRKIIPVVYKDCDLPFDMKLLHRLDYRRMGTYYNFWDKLKQSIEVANYQQIPGRIIQHRPQAPAVTFQEPPTEPKEEPQVIEEKPKKEKKSKNLAWFKKIKVKHFTKKKTAVAS